jgi:hypothetical protein
MDKGNTASEQHMDNMSATNMDMVSERANNKTIVYTISEHSERRVYTVGVNKVNVQHSVHEQSECYTSKHTKYERSTFMCGVTTKQ